MENKKLFIGLLTILFTYSCDSDRCDEGYTEVVLDDGIEVCLPDYVVGIEKPSINSNKFYHTEYGVIEFQNGEWKNQIGENITNLLRAEY
ncbi:hypothetical protein [Maribacter sp. R86514]|uniref:hypothetical protein n=1 Tax=Maribacter sp. R86514 TaxID=3093854 RepID=UPI0037CA0559